METKKILFIITLALMCGCTMFNPAPPLKESEIPYKLQAGVYKDIKGAKHTVSDRSPRWSVSEAYLYDAVTQPNASAPKTSKTTILAVCLSFLGGILTMLLLKTRKINTRRKR